ncbi:MAG: hypothetical protein AAFW89_12960 [Bacteroidota bacterium]
MSTLRTFKPSLVSHSPVIENGGLVVRPKMVDDFLADYRDPEKAASQGTVVSATNNQPKVMTASLFTGPVKNYVLTALILAAAIGIYSLTKKRTS